MILQPELASKRKYGHNMHNFKVVKSSGETEPFDEQKLRRSLRRSGAGDALVDQVLQELKSEWQDGMSTKSIFKRAYKLLKRLHRPVAGRYTLKKAIFEFGNTGFPFEAYVAEILKSRGYDAQIRQMLSGACITHEMDVVAENARHLIWVECKYHPLAGSVSNVKIPLYVHSRFRDLQQRRDAISDRPDSRPVQGWIVTNTRFSEDAERYGQCAGMHLVGWNYPAGGSLREMVDEAGLHPITCLASLSRREKDILLSQDIVLCRTLKEPGKWSNLLHLSPERQAGVMLEARELLQVR